MSEIPFGRANSELNNWQKVATATHDIVTPANAIDLVGFAGAMYGLNHLDTPTGIAITAVSYMTDVIDGKIARATGTASDLGEAVDAGGDKVKLAFAVAKIWNKQLAPRPLIVAIAVQNGLNAALTLADRKLNEEPALHSSSDGKKAIFLEQWGLGLHVIGSEVKKHHELSGQVIKAAGTIVGIVGLGYGARASANYYLTYKASRSDLTT